MLETFQFRLYLDKARRTRLKKHRKFIFALNKRSSSRKNGSAQEQASCFFWGKEHVKPAAHVATFLLLLCQKTRKISKQNMFFHSLGLSALGAALFLQFLVLSDILLNGYFRGVEENSAILSFELFLAAVAAIYLCYLFWNLLRSQA